MSLRLNSFFTHNRELALLTRQAQQHLAIEKQLAEVIPASLRRSCHLLHYAAPCLTLAANNGAVAAKLRQLTTDMAAQLRAKGCEVTVIQVQVQVSAPPEQHKPAPRQISEHSRQQLASFAAGLADSPLKAVLQRLAENRPR